MVRFTHLVDYPKLQSWFIISGVEGQPTIAGTPAHQVNIKHGELQRIMDGIVCHMQLGVKRGYIL